jgi:glycosyltransferase involved in cell wall biosynthesis
MACNTPVVTNVQNPLTLEEREKVGYVRCVRFDLEKAIEFVLDNKSKFHDGRSICRKYFSWQIITQLMIEDYSYIFRRKNWI